MTALTSASRIATRGASAALAPIALDLAEVENVLAGELADDRPHVAKLMQHVELYRGKRLRPALLLLTARACGPLTQAHYTLGAVVEMIHTATLVHDDVLDDATLRRHVPTINSNWGNRSSILLGDMLFSQAFHLASTVGDAQACEIIGRSTNRVCEGELHQISERGNFELSEDAYFDIIDGKTAELTACCCRLGAMYAGADKRLIEEMAEFGRCIGIAFQIADDLLDLIGREDTAGKTLGTDLHQQKLTLPLIHMLRKLTSEKRVQVKELLAAAKTSRDGLKAMLHETGAISYARRRAEDYAQAARSALNGLPASEYRRTLESLTDWTVHREK